MRPGVKNSLLFTARRQILFRRIDSRQETIDIHSFAEIFSTLGVGVKETLYRHDRQLPPALRTH